MAYSAAAILALASQCAPTVAPETVLAIIQTESSGEQFALNVNGGKQPARQTNAADAAATARRYVAAGYSVDLGLGQINSRNMRWLGLTWETVFDPCTNVAALARVLTTNYNSVKAGRDPQTALRVALSMYNTGSQTRGFRNGYVAKVIRNAGVAHWRAMRAADPCRRCAGSERSTRTCAGGKRVAGTVSSSSAPRTAAEMERLCARRL
ncbi:MAG: lytic transglycosylase domain-containing protein [Sphingomonadales bacterium]|nr:lytic transglycosylase domain-containing protein [Sphingomonadales bacterium]